MILIADGLDKVGQEFLNHMADLKLYDKNCLAEYYKFNKEMGKVVKIE